MGHKTFVVCLKVLGKHLPNISLSEEPITLSSPINGRGRGS